MKRYTLLEGYQAIGFRVLINKWNHQDEKENKLSFASVIKNKVYKKAYAIIDPIQHFKSKGLVGKCFSNWKRKGPSPESGVF